MSMVYYFASGYRFWRQEYCNNKNFAENTPLASQLPGRHFFLYIPLPLPAVYHLMMLLSNIYPY